MKRPGRRRPRPTTGRRRFLLAGGAAALGALAGHRTDAVWASPASCAVPPFAPAPFGPPRLVTTATGSPSVVAVEQRGASFRYLVDGTPQRITGIGYNLDVTGLTDDARRDRLDRDFRLMRANGVNTVFGWDPAALDGLALDVAHMHGLGVALPFDVDFRVDFGTVFARWSFRDRVLAWVEAYRHHPALRMWAIGNEVLQRIVPPSWCNEPSEADLGRRAGEWAAAMLDVADAVHALDPSHPIIYRESEDAYVNWIAGALAADPADRPWLLYGINCYSPRLAQILDEWPGRGLNMATLVSEFGIWDAQLGARSDGLRTLWAMIRSRPSYVLGGAVYCWTTNGPEAVDARFGLVDDTGTAVDDALATIAELYQADARASGAADETPA
ncbi:MAG: hypothetical protein IT305_04595 [Chloroflexi bacterium]|nr:hypothetical protein [Chloroflexota bacterium]